MIVLDATSSGSATATSLTISHVIALANNRLLTVGILGGTSDIITGVTFNSIAMTRVDVQNNGNSTAYLYYILAPGVGTHNIVISANTSADLAAGATSFTGVSQTGEPEATVKSTASTTTSLANTLTTLNSNSIHVASFAVDSSAITSVTNGTLISSTGYAYSNPLLIASPGVHTMTANSVGNNAWAGVGASFKAATSSPSAGNFIPFFSS